jgi:hypothetical protein
VEHVHDPLTMGPRYTCGPCNQPIATSPIPQVAQASADRPVMLSELVAALEHVHQRTRNASGETNMTGLLFKLAANRLEGK